MDYSVSKLQKKPVPLFDTLSSAILTGAFEMGDPFSRAQATHVGVAFDVLTPSFLAPLHARSLRVFVYTVNKPADIQRAKAMGVDGIVSDYPERLLYQVVAILFQYPASR